ncbi:MAG TPA: anti-sigma factor antagonist [Lachnospiraceae bacterium]|jgi:stage II sporulation protein AA (anti-sigma F factor antagonist)|nr:anti-sigma factor antagonist [Lachnospiraceae bacterium]HPF28739.1 anti-sigma factor antagonist [Lachnospiraceae bacterium]
MKACKKNGQYLMIQMPEEIDHHQTVQIRQAADESILEDEVRDVIFDFGQTRMMDSSGIGIIMGRYRMISAFGGQVYIMNADTRIKKILFSAGIQKIAEFIN